MLLFFHFIKKPAQAAVSYRVGATEDHGTRQEGTLTADVQAVNSVRETCAGDDVIAEAEADILS